MGPQTSRLLFLGNISGKGMKILSLWKVFSAIFFGKWVNSYNKMNLGDWRELLGMGLVMLRKCLVCFYCWKCKLSFDGPDFHLPFVEVRAAIHRFALLYHKLKGIVLH